ncbi:hypothetical protein RQP46_003716 [Phenoliferia psychrophenolica]
MLPPLVRMGLVALAVVLVLAGTSSGVATATAVETAAARWKEQTDAIMHLHATVKGWDAGKELVGGQFKLGSLDLDLYDAELRHTHQSLLTSEWDHAVLDDAAVTKWVQDKFGDARIVAEFNALPTETLKADAFHYLVVLMEGGVWAPSDSAAVKPILKWGTGSTDVTDPLLLKKDTERATMWSGFDGSTSTTFEAVSSATPALVVSLDGFSRE